MGDSSEVWIWVETEEGTQAGGVLSITPSKLVVVEELVDATILQTADAELITGKANQEYSNYLWQPVLARDPGEFVVRGQLRSKSQ